MGFAARTLLVHREVDDATAAFATSVSLPGGACVAFHDDRASLHRSHVVVPNASSLLSPLIIHAFSERELGYVRLTSVRPAGEHEQSAIRMCRQLPLGLGVPLSHPTSIYHQLFHAVPSWLHLQSALQAAGSSDAPASAFVPLTFASTALGRGKPASPRRWHAWELTLRPLTRASADEIAEAAIELLRAPCTCFERFEATANAFNPGARAAAVALRRFRAAALLRAAPTPFAALPAAASAQAQASTGPRTTLLFVSRRGERRGLTNEPEVLAALTQLKRVQRVAFEELALSAQMQLVSDAAGFIAVHGQALAWLPFLPWDTQPTGVVEISLVGRRGVVNKCYEQWSAALGVRYWRVTGTLSHGCNGGASRRDNEAERQHKLLACNVSVNVRDLYGAASRVSEHTALPAKL